MTMTERDLRALAGGKFDRRQFVQRAGGLVAASSFAGTLLAACGGDDGGGGNGEIGGTLSTFNWAGYDDKEIAGPFLEKYDITLDSSEINNQDTILTQLKTGGAGRIDLVSPNVILVPEYAEAGVLQEIDYERIPRTKEYLPNMAGLGEQFGVDGNTYVAPYLWGINAMIYNQAAVPSTPKTWEDLLRPEYTDRVVLIDTAADNVVTWAPVLGYDPQNLTTAQLDELTDFLIELKTTQVRSLASSYDDVADQLARGDVWVVGSAIWIATPQLAAGKGGGAADITWTLPEPGGATWIDGWVIPSEAPNPDTAYAFIDYMLGAKQQSELAEKFVSGTVVKDAIPLLTPEARRTYPYFDMETLETKAPVYQLPGPDAEVQLDDWTKAWTKVQAAS